MTTRDLDAAHFHRDEAFALLTVIARWVRLGLNPADMLRRLADKCEDKHADDTV